MIVSVNLVLLAEVIANEVEAVFDEIVDFVVVNVVILWIDIIIDRYYY